MQNAANEHQQCIYEACQVDGTEISAANPVKKLHISEKLWVVWY